MKTESKKILGRLKVKKSSALFAPLMAAIVGCMTQSAQAAVQVTQFDPPLQISAYAEPSENSFFNVTAADLDANGEVDFHLAYGFGAMTAVFNAPLRFAQRVSQPDSLGRGGPVAGVPLNSMIGTNIVSSITTNFFVWSSGYTNRDDLTQPLGDHHETVIIANLFAAVAHSEPTISITPGGVLFTNIIYPQPIASGDVVGKDAVMALEFYIDGQRHYGYIHCNFQGGASGVIYGWAYETEPNVAIKAESLNRNQAPIVPQEHSGIVGVVNEGNLPGWTVSVSTLRGNFVTNVLTKAQGLFNVNLKPGAYRVQSLYVPHPVPGQLLPAVILQGASKSVTVRRNHFTFIELGSGIGTQPLSEILR